MQHLYRHFNKDRELLYVGVSLSAVHRLGQHADHSHWFKSIARVEIENFETREEVLAAERKAIIEENPKHNLKRPKVEQQRVEEMIRQIEESRTELERRVVLFKPMYTTKEAADLLSRSARIVKQLIDRKELGCVYINTGAKEPKCYITGWQLIDYFEQLQGKPTR